MLIRKFAFCLAIVISAGCASPPPPRNYPVSGRIGVATSSAPKAYLPSVGQAAAWGALQGLMLLPLVPLGAAIAADCAGNLHAAFPGASGKINDIVLREFSHDDLRNAFGKAIAERTSAQIIALDGVPAAGSTAGEGFWLSAMERSGLDFLIQLDMQEIGVLPYCRGNEPAWYIGAAFAAKLWRKGHREPVLSRPMGPVQGRNTILPLAQLKPILETPGALRPHLARVFEAMSIRLLDSGELQLPK